MEYPHNYMRPPPPPDGVDPYQRPPGNPQLLPWSGQFQYHSQTQTQPPPPPYAATPPPPPYPAQYPTPPPHHLPPRLPPPQPFYSQSYHQPQESGSGSWSRHEYWDYTANNEVEDWAAKARAWAAAKSASESQHPQPQLVQVGQPEVLSHNVDQYSQINTQFSDDHMHTTQAPNYYPIGIGTLNGACQGQMQPGESSYATNTPVPYAARDGSSAGSAVATFPQPEKSPLGPFVHQQEVPSTYSSVPGNEEAGNRYEKFDNSLSLPAVSITINHVHPLPPAVGQPAEFVPDLSNQPLNFAPQYNLQLDPHVQSNYAHSRSTDPAISPNYVWGPSSAAGTIYPPVPPLIPSLPPVDRQIPPTSHASAHPAQSFPTGAGFLPPASVVGGTFGVGTGLTPQPTPSSSNGYGVPGLSERTKKASVPNWLREEIIKNKSVAKNTVSVIPHTKYSEGDRFNGSYEKGDQADSKSIDSSKSSEDEDGDEDEEAAARAAAINQEIKRVLTEVLLKVTDELFGDIATNVLKGDDSSDLVGHESESAMKNVAPLPPATITPMAAAKVRISKKIIGSDIADSSEKSASGLPGGLLGLANYASDEEGGEVQSPNLPYQNKSSTMQQSSSSMLLEDKLISKNGDFHEKVDDPVTKLDAGPRKNSPVMNLPKSSARNKELNYNVKDKELAPGDGQSNAGVVVSRRLMGDDHNLKITGYKSPENNSYENKIESRAKGNIDSESSMEKLDMNSDEERSRHGERRVRSERTGSPGDDFRGKSKTKGRSGERSIKDSDSTKSSENAAERVSGSGRERNSGKDDDERKWARSRDEKKERSRHKSERESGRHKHANDSSDKSSDDSKRKSHNSRRRRSPSPIRQRKRNVSRSPHGKHSKRRHSPYSSLENTRRRSLSRSSSRSPPHRRR